MFVDSSLPEDLLIDILSLLPVKSLLRFKCACKSWLTILESPFFIAKHLSNDHRRFFALTLAAAAVVQQPRTTTLAVIFAVLDQRRAIAKSRLSRVCKTLSYNTLEVISQDLSKCFKGYLELLGIYNGIACFRDRLHDNIHFFNLATRERHTVQGCQLGGRRREYAFGYDFKTDDYKVIRMTSITRSKHGSEVYNLSTDSWSKSDALILDGFFFTRYGYNCYEQRPVSVCVNGIFSMVVYRGNEEARRNSLLTFDMSNEVSIVTPISESIDFAWRKLFLMTLNNSVALIKKREPSQLVYSYEIFALNEYGPNGTWIKMYTIGHFYGITLPLELWKDDYLLLKGSNRELVLWDLKANELMKTVADCGHVCQLIEYKESLVSPKKRA